MKGSINRICRKKLPLDFHKILKTQSEILSLIRGNFSEELQRWLYSKHTHLSFERHPYWERVGTQECYENILCSAIFKDQGINAASWGCGVISSVCSMPYLEPCVNPTRQLRIKQNYTVFLYHFWYLFPVIAESETTVILNSSS